MDEERIPVRKGRDDYFNNIQKFIQQIQTDYKIIFKQGAHGLHVLFVFALFLHGILWKGDVKAFYLLTKYNLCCMINTVKLYLIQEVLLWSI